MQLTLPSPVSLQLPNKITLPSWDKLKSIKDINIKSLIEIQSEPQITLQIIPHFNITNGIKIEKILDGLHSLDIPIHERFKIQNNKLIYNTKRNFSYAILLESTNISFYYTIPCSIQDWFIQRVYSNWTNQVTIISSTPYLSKFSNSNLNSTSNNTTLEWQLKPKHPTYKSLRDDYRDTPIPSILSTSKDLSDTTNDRILLEFTFSPIHDSLWKEKTLENQQKYRKGLIQDNLKTGIGWSIGDGIMKILDGIFEFSNILFEVKPKKRNYYYSHSTNEMLEQYDPKSNEVKYNMNRNKLNSSSRQKINHNGFNGKLRILSQSEDKTKRDIFAKTMQVALRELHNDNEFIVSKKKLLKNEDINKSPKINFIFDHYVYSSKEIGQLIQLPTKQWQQEYKIQKVDIHEVNVPNELTTGYIPIGTAIYKNIPTLTNWSKNHNILSLPKIVIGPMNSGKSQYTKNYTINAHRNGDSLVIFDYIQNCELSEGIAKQIDCIKFDLSKQINLFALAYPEIQPNENDKWDRLKTANILSRQTEFLINSLSVEPLSVRMVRYLDAACKIVFIHKGKGLSDVINVLTNHIIRNKFIELALESKCFYKDDSEILDLLSLNGTDNKGNVIGTKDAKIDGILDRTNTLLKDLYLRSMMKAEINYDINFTKWIDEGKTIIIQIPEHTFTNKQIKDTLVTYFMGRIWLSALQRKNPSKVCHVITDEVHQVPVCTSLLTNIITEGRKFGISFYFTIHYLKQFKGLLDAVKSSGASYMLLTGTEKENFNMLQEELQPFTIDDLINMKPWHSLNYVNYNNQYVKYISKLPEMIE